MLVTKNVYGYWYSLKYKVVPLCYTVSNFCLLEAFAPGISTGLRYSSSFFCLALINIIQSCIKHALSRKQKLPQDWEHKVEKNIWNNYVCKAPVLYTIQDNSIMLKLSLKKWSTAKWGCRLLFCRRTISGSISGSASSYSGSSSRSRSLSRSLSRSHSRSSSASVSHSPSGSRKSRYSLDPS